MHGIVFHSIVRECGAVEKVLFLHNCNRLRREFIITTKP